MLSDGLRKDGDEIGSVVDFKDGNDATLSLLEEDFVACLGVCGGSGESQQLFTEEGKGKCTVSSREASDQSQRNLVGSSATELSRSRERSTPELAENNAQGIVFFGSLTTKTISRTSGRS